MNVIDKIQKLLDRIGWDQTELEKRAKLPKNRITKWKGGTGEPTLRQGLRMARELGVPITYLADDTLDELPPPEISDDERAVIDLYHALDLDRREAMRRLAGEVPARVATVRPIEDQPGRQPQIGQAGRMSKSKKSAM